MAKNENRSAQEVYYQNAWAGDYSNFESLSPEGRNDLASQYMEEMSKRYPGLGTSSPDDKDLGGLLSEQAMNPVFRLGCSLRARAGEGAPKCYEAYDDYMNSYIMRQSLSPLDKNRLQNLKDQGLTGEALNRTVAENVEKQTLLAKSLFLAHLGDTYLQTGEPGAAPQRQELNRPVSSMMAHCSRTAYVFPPGDRAQQNRLFGAILGPGMGKEAGVARRMAATHSVSSGPTVSDFREEKKFSMMNQYGMNIAIGGAGNPGVSGPNGRQILKADGSSGHMYMHIDKGGENKCSSLLVGFESDAPGVKNQQGHRHDAKATPETMSSFLGQRSDEMGRKYGGRIVDCTHLSPRKLENAVNDFAARYRTILTEGMSNPDVRGELDKLNSALCGNHMDKADLAAFMGRMNMNRETVKDVLSIDYLPSLDASPARCISELNYNQQQPKKPGFFTRLKASFGNTEAKKACQDHKDYQSSLAGRAERGLDTGAPGNRIKRGSMQQLVGDMGKERWKDMQPNERLKSAYWLMKPLIGIGRHRQPESAEDQAFYIPNPPLSPEPDNSREEEIGPFKAFLPRQDGEPQSAQQDRIMPKTVEELSSRVMMDLAELDRKEVEKRSQQNKPLPSQQLQSAKDAPKDLSPKQPAGKGRKR